MNAGDRLGPWVIDAEIGRGAMGTVWRARHADTGQVVAVKRLNPELARDELFVQRFRREIEALGQLDHPNIVRFLEAGEGDGSFYYAMEYVDGRDCEAILRDRGRLDRRTSSTSRARSSRPSSTPTTAASSTAT